MIRLFCTLDGFAQESWMFTFETHRDLVAFLRKLGKGQLKRTPICRVLMISTMTGRNQS